MIKHEQKLCIGAPRDASLPKTMELFLGKIRRMGTFSEERLLDVGCGGGSFTRALGTDFREVHGIDVQEDYLEQFREAVKDDHRFLVSNMSASDMAYPEDFLTRSSRLRHWSMFLICPKPRARLSACCGPVTNC